MWGLQKHAGRPNEKCATLLNKRVRVKEGDSAGKVGLVATVCPDKLGDPYQVHVKLDGDDQVTIFSPGDVEPETVN